MDKKALSFTLLTALVIGNMIGTGIYVLPASLAAFGTLSLFAWIFTSLGALFLALTFAHLNKRYPKTGGPIVYCQQAYGNLGGFVIAYTYWFSNLVSIAGLAVASVGYLGFLTPLLDANQPTYQALLAFGIELVIVWSFTLVNIIGVHTAGMVQLILTIIKVLPLIIISLLGLSHIQMINLHPATVPHSSHLAAITSAATLTFWSFIGLESATVPAENTQGSRDVFKATVIGTVVTGLIYIVSSFVLMGMIPSTILESSQFPFAQAGTLLFGNGAATLITLCAVISGIGALNGCILLQGQIVFASARAGYFPSLFAKLSKQDSPIAGQLVSSTIISVFLFLTIKPTLLKQFNNLALLAGLLTLITYFITMLAEMKFILQAKKSLLTIFSSKSFFITLIASFYSAWMIKSFDYSTLMMGIFCLLLIAPAYLIKRRLQS